MLTYLSAAMQYVYTGTMVFLALMVI
jgi:hypothetical protein